MGAAVSVTMTCALSMFRAHDNVGSPGMRKHGERKTVIRFSPRYEGTCLTRIQNVRLKTRIYDVLVIAGMCMYVICLLSMTCGDKMLVDLLLYMLYVFKSLFV